MGPDGGLRAQRAGRRSTACDRVMMSDGAEPCNYSLAWAETTRNHQ